MIITMAFSSSIKMQVSKPVIGRKNDYSLSMFPVYQQEDSVTGRQGQGEKVRTQKGHRLMEISTLR